jgi:uncharacterized protein with GYD domain
MRLAGRGALRWTVALPSFEEWAMPTHLSLMTLTDKGMRAVRDSPRRLDAAKKMLEEMDGTFRQLFMTMGAYDLVLVYEAPDDALSARFQPLLGAQGDGPRR